MVLLCTGLGLIGLSGLMPAQRSTQLSKHRNPSNCTTNTRSTVTTLFFSVKPVLVLVGTVVHLLF
jgi:hypothetical protein